MTQWTARPVQINEITVLASIWHGAWHDAHALVVPTALVEQRTLAEFAGRLADLGDAVRTIGPVGAPLGLCATRDDQLYQIYVSQAARGTGVAACLLEDGEARLSADGVHEARLDCVTENVRAIRFYGRNGWIDSGTATVSLESAAGGFPLEVRIFKKNLRS